MKIHGYFQNSRSLTNFVSSVTLSLFLINTPTAVFAGAGHDHGSGAFQGENEPTGQVEIDPQTLERLGIKVEPVKLQPLDIAIKTTGKIETLPNQKVEVTTPISGVKVVELLVEPGAKVKKGQPVAILTSPELVNLRIESQEKLAEAEADLQQALADLKLAQQNYQRFQNIAQAEIIQAESQVAFALEKYNKDKQLAEEGALPRRSFLESETQLAQAKAGLVNANSRRDVIVAENQLQRAKADVKVAKERIKLSNANYQTRLTQLETIANEKGTVVVTAPISGQIADRQVTIGQSFEDAGGQLMTIVNDNRVFATANIYEKDLNQVEKGQLVKIKVANLPDRTFRGIISRIGSVVQGETRTISVQAEIQNSREQLKPGMFAQLEVVTDKTSVKVLTIPSSAVVDVNGKKIVYVKNGNSFQAIEPELGRTSGDLIEVTSGLFLGDEVVTQRGLQLYAQSLRGGSDKEEEHEHSEEESQLEENGDDTNNFPLPLWLIVSLAGTVIAGGSFAMGSLWSGNRQKSIARSILPVFGEQAMDIGEESIDSENTEKEIENNISTDVVNHHQKSTTHIDGSKPTLKTHSDSNR